MCCFQVQKIFRVSSLAVFAALLCQNLSHELNAQEWQPSSNFMVLTPGGQTFSGPAVERMFRQFHATGGFPNAYTGSFIIPPANIDEQLEKLFKEFENQPALVFSFDAESGPDVDNGPPKAVPGDMWSIDIDTWLQGSGYLLANPAEGQKKAPIRAYVKKNAAPDYVGNWNQFFSLQSAESIAALNYSRPQLTQQNNALINTWSDSTVNKRIPFHIVDPLFTRKNQVYSGVLGAAGVPSELAQSIRYFHTPGATDADHRGALDVLQREAKRGNAVAQYELAEQLRYGNAVKRSLADAQNWYIRAASGQGEIATLAALSAGDIAFHGVDGKPDYQQAKSMYELAAKGNDPRAQTWLGFLSLNGLGTPTNIELAAAHFQRGAKRQDPVAQYYLARMHDAGQIPDIDDGEAIRLYSIASRAGFRPATAALYRKARSGDLIKITDVGPDIKQGEFKIFYATNRNTLEPATPDERFFGSGRRKNLVYGKASVSAVLENEDLETKKGFIERVIKNVVDTFSEFFSDKTGKFSTLDVQELSYENFSSEIVEQHKAIKNQSKASVLIFVHGFMNTFESSVERAAQLAYDLNFRGPVIVFSWPAQNNPLEIGVATTDALWSAEYLDKFLNQIPDLQGTYLIAHSKGNEVLLNFVARYTHSNSIRQYFDELLLAAPDVDTDTFGQHSGLLKQMAARITLYMSSDDAALELARIVYGYTRLGDAGSGIVIIDDIDTIDASNAGEDLFGHAFSESKLIMEDIYLLINHRFPPSDRRTDPVPKPPEEPKYWRLKTR